MEVSSTEISDLNLQPCKFRLIYKTEEGEWFYFGILSLSVKIYQNKYIPEIFNQSIRVNKRTFPETTTKPDTVPR